MDIIETDLKINQEVIVIDPDTLLPTRTKVRGVLRHHTHDGQLSYELDLPNHRDSRAMMMSFDRNRVFIDDADFRANVQIVNRK